MIFIAPVTGWYSVTGLGGFFLKKGEVLEIVLKAGDSIVRVIP